MATSNVVTASDDSSSDRVLTRETLPLYLGGFLGPFGTMVVIPIYPELRETFGATTEQVNWAFSGYVLPMAALLFISGTIGERLGRRRVTQATFVAYGVASVLAILAPTLELFIASRVLQGIGNAFVTPLLVAGLTEVIAPQRLGRALGVYSSFQAAGAALAPLAAGLAAVANWRLVFVVVALVSFALATRPPEGEPRPAASAPPIRPLLSGRMALLWTASFSAAAGPIGIAVLVGLVLRDELEIGPTGAGTVLLVGGLAAMLLGPTWGRLLDAWGPVRSSVVSTSALASLTAPIGLLTNLATLVVVWVAAAALVGFVVINLQGLSATAVPENRGGALSSVLAFRFIGHAVGPLIWVPTFSTSPTAAFAGAGALGLVTLVTMTTAAARAGDGLRP